MRRVNQTQWKCSPALSPRSAGGERGKSLLTVSRCDPARGLPRDPVRLCCQRMKRLRIGLIGDYNGAVTAHRAIPLALELAATSLRACQVETIWLPTETLAEDVAARMDGLHGLWCVPASPYASLEGALGGIRFARTKRVPFLGTCGGFQHALIEYARNVRGLAQADHSETNPAAALPLISRLSCSLVEQEGQIFLQAGSRIHQIYDRPEILEMYHCNFGLNPVYEALVATGQLQITGRDRAGEPRVLELNDHPFFIATLFQPERSALRGQVHPLIRAYVQAVNSCP